MSETLFLVKFSNNFGTGTYGICKVISHKGAIVTETEANEWGSGFYRFKVIGSSKQIITKAGLPKREKQRLFCTVKKDSVFATTAKDLNYGDILEIFGVMTTKEYTNENGKKKRTSFCNLCKLTVIVKADGTPINEIETEAEEDYEDEFGE